MLDKLRSGIYSKARLFNCYFPKELHKDPRCTLWEYGIPPLFFLLFDFVFWFHKTFFFLKTNDDVISLESNAEYK